MNRRRWLGATGAAALCVACLPIHAQAGVAAPIALRSIAVLDVELVDDQNNPLTKAAQEVRLRNATMQLRQELGERQLYEVIDPAPSQDLQLRLRSQQEFLYRCDDCAGQIGGQLRVDLVMTPWVQKVSELILNSSSITAGNGGGRHGRRRRGGPSIGVFHGGASTISSQGGTVINFGTPGQGGANNGATGMSGTIVP